MKTEEDKILAELRVDIDRGLAEFVDPPPHELNRRAWVHVHPPPKISPEQMADIIKWFNNHYFDEE